MIVDGLVHTLAIAQGLDLQRRGVRAVDVQQLRFDSSWLLRLPYAKLGGCTASGGLRWYASMTRLPLLPCTLPAAWHGPATGGAAMQLVTTIEALVGSRALRGGSDLLCCGSPSLLSTLPAAALTCDTAPHDSASAQHAIYLCHSHPRTQQMHSLPCTLALLPHETAIAPTAQATSRAWPTCSAMSSKSWALGSRAVTPSFLRPFLSKLW